MLNWLKRFWDWLHLKAHTLEAHYCLPATKLAPRDLDREWVQDLDKHPATQKIRADYSRKGSPAMLTTPFTKDDFLVRDIEMQNIRKQLQSQRIAEKNRDRQKSTLGYGLKSRNFRPRPASEKKLWKLDKKADEEN